MTTFGRTNPKLTFRLGKPEDVRPLLDKYGSDFFHEAGFDEFSPFDIERATDVMAAQIQRGDTPFILATLNNEVVGMISYTLSHVFTAQPIAVLWMFYVMPPYRRSAAGRMLLWFAIDMARGDDACAFFSTVAPTSIAGRSLCNLLRRAGFKPMGGAFSRRL
jgi:GNAT superfamily N-acetyltransferase